MDRPGYVYVVSLGLKNVYKIGRTSNMADRLKALTASNPHVMAVIASRVDDMVEVEQKLHKRYRSRLVEREVFLLDRAMLRSIQQYLDMRRPGRMDGAAKVEHDPQANLDPGTRRLPNQQDLRKL